MNNILVTRSSMPPFDEYCDEIKDIWDSHWLTNMGSKTQRVAERAREISGHSTCSIVYKWASSIGKCDCGTKSSERRGK